MLWRLYLTQRPSVNEDSALPDHIADFKLLRVHILLLKIRALSAVTLVGLLLPLLVSHEPCRTWSSS